MPSLKNNYWRNNICVTIVLLFILFPTLLISQNDIKTTRVKIKGGRFFISADTSYFVKNDSLVTIPVNLDYMVSRYPPIDDANTYKNIRKKTSKNKLMQSLSQLTFVETDGIQGSGEKQASISANPYTEYEGKVISNIRFKTLEPFGPSLQDTSGQPYAWAGRFGNSIHIETREYILRDNLIVGIGETIDPLILYDNELIIRNLSFIDDIKIIILPIENSDSVDLLFVSKDKFSFGFNPIIKSINSFSLKVWNENFYGLGHKVEGEMSVITDRSPVMRFEQGNYTIPNINGSFIRGELGYAFVDDQHQYNISFSRGFLPPTFKTGLGMAYRRYVFDDYYINQDSVIKLQDIDLEAQSAFLGHSFGIYDNPRSELHGVYLTPGFSILRKHYNRRPYITPEYIGLYRNSLLFIGNISLSQNNFYRTNYFFEFGRTEDVPYGFQLNLSAGYETGEYYNRIYSGFSFSASEYINNFGYLFAEVNLGGYYREGHLEEGILDFEINYASKLFRVRHNNVRLFAEISYTMGMGRLTGEYLRFTGEEGINGFSSNLVYGQKRLSFNVEPVVFTPWVFLGFRFVFFAFASYGLISPENKSIFDNYLYSGYGIGIRIRNDNLVFNTLELSVGIFPNSPDDQDNLIWSMGGIPTPEFSNFLPKAPGTHHYR